MADTTWVVLKPGTPISPQALLSFVTQATLWGVSTIRVEQVGDSVHLLAEAPPHPVRETEQLRRTLAEMVVVLAGVNDGRFDDLLERARARLART